MEEKDRLQSTMDKRKECLKDIEKTTVILNTLENKTIKTVISKTVDSTGETKDFYMEMMSIVSNTIALLKTYLEDANGYVGVLDEILIGNLSGMNNINEKLEPFVENLANALVQIDRICKTVQNKIKISKKKELKINYSLFDMFLRGDIG